ncbi:MAG: signal recognition particle protein, partial [Clostridia bacterium]|nr:signal recognition particle protein [Clostridia bacterium]
VLASLTPGQQVVKVVYDELRELLGGETARLPTTGRSPALYLLVGLQGSGKTTTCAKLASWLRSQGRRPFLVAADVQRPAAVDQLETLGRQVGVPTFSDRRSRDPVAIARRGVEEAVRVGCDVVLVDTAGRLHVDEPLMEELRSMKEVLAPDGILLVLDAMTGQDAVNVAEAFRERLGFDGVVLTKLDGDARGGAALSVRAVTGRPILFVGVGEKVDALEAFHPDRMASRILGMGDVLSLIERLQAGVDVEKARDMERRLRANRFTLEDFLEQLQQVRRMGPLEEILSLLPGAASLRQLKGLKLDPRELVHVEAIIRSMTPEEREHPEIIDGSRRRRIARGSGRPVSEVNRLLREFEEVRRVIRGLTAQGRKGKKAWKKGMGSLWP